MGLVVQRVQNHYYGCSDLDVTGPRVMGSAVERFYDSYNSSDWINHIYSNATDYVLTAKGVKTIITCCDAARGRISKEQLQLGILSNLRPTVRRRKRRVGIYGSAWCNFTIYHSQ